jgi:uncharacterized protein YidB (DUF937 family)
MSDILSRILAGVMGGNGGAAPRPQTGDDYRGDSPLGTPTVPEAGGGGLGGLLGSVLGGGGSPGGGLGGGIGGGQGGGLGGILGGLLGGGMLGGTGARGGGLAGGLGGVKGMALMGLLAYMMRGQGGARGLSSLTDHLRSAGLGSQVDSWVQDGPNNDISPDELRRAVPTKTLDAVARETGQGQDEILSQLSRGLPGMVDRLTPRGRLPERDEDLPDEEPDNVLRGFGIGQR